MPDAFELQPKIDRRIRMPAARLEPVPWSEGVAGIGHVEVPLGSATGCSLPDRLTHGGEV